MNDLTFNAIAKDENGNSLTDQFTVKAHTEKGRKFLGVEDFVESVNYLKSRASFPKMYTEAARSELRVHLEH